MSHVLAFLLVGLVPQDTQPTSAGDPLATFRALPTLRKAGVLRRIERRCATLGDPALARISALRTTGAEAPPRESPGFHSPEEWTKGVAPPRSRIGEDDPAHHPVRERFPKLLFLDDLAPSLGYEWHTGRVVREPEAAGYEQRFANALHGYAPDTDAVVAHLLARFDVDPAERPLAAYLEHWWADLDAKVYEGVTLFEAWSSGRIVDVPDVDAIPFAVQILKDRSFVSPIPADQRRSGLYEKIRAAANRHRRYRSVLLAAAAAAVRAEPILEPSYRELVPRFHLAWVRAGDDLAAMTKLVAAAAADRDAFVRDTDELVIRDERVRLARDRRKRELAAMQAAITEIALRELAAER